MRVGLRITDDDVVHEVDVDHLGGFTELPSDLDIRSARGRVAGGVVVLCGVPSYVQ
jgi:hypothetical protein